MIGIVAMHFVVFEEESTVWFVSKSLFISNINGNLELISLGISMGIFLHSYIVTYAHIFEQNQWPCTPQTSFTNLRNPICTICIIPKTTELTILNSTVPPTSKFARTIKWIYLCLSLCIIWRCVIYLIIWEIALSFAYVLK